MMLCKLELDPLVFPDGFPERLPFLDVGNAVLQGLGGGTHTDQTDDPPGQFVSLVDVVESLVLLTAEVVLRDLHVLDIEAAAGYPFPPELLEIGGGDARGIVQREIEHAHPTGPEFGFHPRQGDMAASIFHGLGHPADVRFLPVDDVTVTLPRDPGLHVPEIRTDIGFRGGDPQEPFPLQGRWQNLLFCFLGAVFVQHVGPGIHHQEEHGDGAARIGPGKFLSRDARGHRVQTETPVFRLHHHAKQFEVGKGLDDLHGHLFGTLKEFHLRNDVLRAELPHTFPEKFLFLRKCIINHG